MKGRKKFWGGLLGAGMMTACVLSVSAATCTQHVFNFSGTPVYTEITSDSGTHTTIQYQLATCSNAGCGQQGKNIASQVTESHKMKYSDAGHILSGLHRYWATCSYCDYSTSVVISCNGSDHATP